VKSTRVANSKDAAQIGVVVKNRWDTLAQEILSSGADGFCEVQAELKRQ